MQGDDPRRSAGVREGEILAGKYRVERVLGVGGMGVVVAARHLQLDTRVAIKFLLPSMLGNEEAVARFANEARRAVKIQSEHVARVLDVGTLDNGAPYMVMEYLQGADLSAVLRQRGPLPVEEAVDYLLQAMEAIAEAHALGIVHRDLKPANLFSIQRPDGRASIKVLDFGISKLTDAESAEGVSVTKTSALMGSPLYMSPEQMRSSKDVDSRTDIWALGVILFELVTGRPPFMSDSVTELAIVISIEPTPSVRAFRGDAPAGLDAIVFRCLEKQARDRYRDVAEFAVALLPFAPRRAKASVDRISGTLGGGGPAESDLPSPSSYGFPATGTLPAVGLTTPGATRIKRSAVGAIAIGAVAIGAIAAVAGLLPRSTDGREGPPSTTPSTEHAAATTPPAGPAYPSALGTTVFDSSPPSEPDASAPAPTTIAVVPGAEHRHPKWDALPSPVPVNGPPAAAVPAPTAPARPNCDPPYYYDKQGNRIFKQECPL
jgi:eukaryotic-like serine/threonine-protein kinase